MTGASSIQPQGNWQLQSQAQSPTQTTAHIPGHTQPLPVLHWRRSSNSPSPLKSLVVEVPVTSPKAFSPVNSNVRSPRNTKSAIRECAFEDIGQGLLVGVFGPEVLLEPEKQLDTHPDGNSTNTTSRKNSNGNSKNSSPSNAENSPAIFDEGHNDSDGGTTIARKSPGSQSTRPYNYNNGRSNPDEFLREQKRRVRILTIKAEGLADYLREELNGFRMPKDLE
jgi:hypothetical protein